MKKYDWSKERIQKAVAKTKCWYDCLEELNIPKRGCNWRTLKRKVEKFNIDVSHFNYKYAKTHNGKHQKKFLINKTNSEIFKFSPKTSPNSLKSEYIKRFLNGVAKCECCGIIDWQNKPLVFQLHHINGDHKDCRKENLQLLCPNCHSQTDNFANKNLKRC